MGTISVGVSGWDYDAWSGTFYPNELPRSQRLAYLAERFDTVEVNGSFYSLLTPKHYRGWYDATPARFVMALKGSRFITHTKRLREVETALANFLASGPLALGHKLGPILWQLPARQAFDAERLRAFVAMLPKDTMSAAALARRHDDRVSDVHLDVSANHRMRHVLEVRHPSFFCEEAVRILRDGGLALAVSHAAAWPLREEVTVGWMYLRLHGAPKTYESGYPDDALEAWCRRVDAWHRAAEPTAPQRITDRSPPRRKQRDVYVYFDNDAGGHAPRNAASLRRMVATGCQAENG